MEYIESHVLAELITAFWQVSTQLIQLIIPVFALWLLFKFISSLLFVDRA